MQFPQRLVVPPIVVLVHRIRHHGPWHSTRRPTLEAAALIEHLGPRVAIGALRPKSPVNIIQSEHGFVAHKHRPWTTNEYALLRRSR